MGIRYMLIKAELARQLRERKRQEKLGKQKEMLHHRLVPKRAAVNFRCQLQPGCGEVKKGDMLILYTTRSGVTATLGSNKIGEFLPAAAADFAANFAASEKSDARIAEVITNPSPIDHTVDVVLRPPWDDTPSTP